MRLGIDASNISIGGGVTHLVEMLNGAQPLAHGFDMIVVWSSKATLSQLPERSWLKKIHDPILEKALAYRIYWQRFILERYLHQEKCDMLFVPGGTYIGRFRPFVTMSRNMLPFEWSEARRYQISWMCIKMILLRFMQIQTFKAADGLIFLTKYAQDIITQTTPKICNKSIVIPHGMNNLFPLVPRIQFSLSDYTLNDPIKILYVSTVDVFKHQWHVAEAMVYLKDQRIPIHLDLIGASYSSALRRLSQVLKRVDPANSFIKYHGLVAYSELYKYYHKSDIFVFASSCENMPNILLEAMAAGLPIACSNRGPMPEVLGNAGVYFNPEKPLEIAAAIGKLIEDPALRAAKAKAAYELSKDYTWERCANETFDFIEKVAKTFVTNQARNFLLK